MTHLGNRVASDAYTNCSPHSSWEYCKDRGDFHSFDTWFSPCQWLERSHICCGRYMSSKEHSVRPCHLCRPYHILKHSLPDSWGRRNESQIWRLFCWCQGRKLSLRWSHAPRFSSISLRCPAFAGSTVGHDKIHTLSWISFSELKRVFHNHSSKYSK